MSVAETTQTVTYDPEGGNIAISRDGHLLDDALVTKLSEFMWTTIEEAFEYSNSHGEDIPPERSLYDFFKAKVEQSPYSQAEQQLCLDACQLWGAYVGDPIQRQSLKFFCLEECIDGSMYYHMMLSGSLLTHGLDNYFVASTYKRILAYVSKAAQTHADIKFNQPVVRIDAPPRDSNQTTDQHQVTVTTAPGDQHRFDEVVITCPLGWLKRNTTAFNPPLPDRLLEAINNISYGRLEKVYITFPRAFWHHEEEATTPQTPVFAQFLEPTYTPHPENVQWNQECLSLASLPRSSAHPTLLFYTYGPCATHIVNQLTPYHPSSPEYTQTLTTFLQPFYSRLPG